MTDLFDRAQKNEQETRDTIWPISWPGALPSQTRTPPRQPLPEL